MTIIDIKTEITGNVWKIVKAVGDAVEEERASFSFSTTAVLDTAGGSGHARAAADVPEAARGGRSLERPIDTALANAPDAIARVDRVSVASGSATTMDTRSRGSPR